MMHIFLTFVKGKPKFAYAVSFGANNAFEGEQGLKYINYIRDFKGISVREKNAQKWIEQATGKKELITLDPTMLFDKEEWERIVEVKAEPIISGKYISITALALMKIFRYSSTNYLIDYRFRYILLKLKNGH